VSVALVALGTLFALVPLRSLGNLSFRLGLPLNDVPIAGFYWLLIWTSLALSRVTSTHRPAGRRSGWPPCLRRMGEIARDAAPGP
jgi:hypothetical protein